MPASMTMSRNQRLAKEAAERGANALDEWYGSEAWADEIVLNGAAGLRMSDMTRCVLGQLFGGFHRIPGNLMKHMGRTTPTGAGPALIYHGFDILNGENDYFPELTDAWYSEIEGRQGWGLVTPW